MDICKAGHPEIAHSRKWPHCPICNMKWKHLEQLGKLRDEIEDLKWKLEQTGKKVVRK